MYFIISRLNEAKLVKLDYLVNFGVSLDVIHLFLENMEGGGDYEDFTHVLVLIPFGQLLKVYKYLSWADKKLHSPLYIENKDQITEDLLSDFIDHENDSKIMKPKGLSKNLS